jgi:hypothetical protein
MDFRPTVPLNPDTHTPSTERTDPHFHARARGIPLAAPRPLVLGTGLVRFYTLFTQYAQKAGVASLVRRDETGSRVGAFLR